jgi:hypothetical protein
MRGGDSDLCRWDFAFIGNQQGLWSPLLVILNPDLPWKWIAKKVAMSVGPLEHYDANLPNA